jgi:transposase
MVEGTLGSHHKEGSKKMSKHSMICAGIDTGKRKLDVAIRGRADELQVDNMPDGHGTLSAWLRRHRVKRVGIEASGGYEQAIADCTAAISQIHAPPDPRLAPFAKHLTLIEQITEDVARLKNRRESCRDKRIQRLWSEEIARLNRILRSERRQLVAAIRRHPDLAERLELMASVDGVGLPTAVAILVRMPEIGHITREQVAALAGLAPYDDDSGDHVGARCIAGGRERLRKSIYNATLAACFRWNAQLIAIYQRLIAAGKTHKVARIACARKLLIYVNTVVERGTPWVQNPAAA